MQNPTYIKGRFDFWLLPPAETPATVWGAVLPTSAASRFDRLLWIVNYPRLDLVWAPMARIRHGVAISARINSRRGREYDGWQHCDCLRSDVGCIVSDFCISMQIWRFVLVLKREMDEFFVCERDVGNIDLILNITFFYYKVYILINKNLL